MRQLIIRPALYSFDNCVDFIHEFDIGKGDCILTTKGIFNPYFGELDIGADIVFQEQYGTGDLSDDMAEAVFAGMKSGCKRIVAIGGGAVLDLAKLCALRNPAPVADLVDRKLAIEKDKELILVPTTCGSGGEVTNIAALELRSRRARVGLASEELYADAAVMIPQLLEGFPYAAFAASSLDALVHAAESFVSPRATPYTRLFARQAIEIILRGYQVVARDGELARVPLLADFLAASNYAGISFGNAGLGAVHAMSYPVERKYRVPHGEIGHALFIKVFTACPAKRNGCGALARLNRVVAESLGCGAENPWPALETLLGRILARKPLRTYGVTEKDLPDFIDTVLTKQGRFPADSFVSLNAGDMMTIYRQAY
ncbi:MAG: 4-hydroxybutyrate dehydrogenase [Planctomycetota bacterium]|nr:4-hydroxybutyrate dehydrogenase [Planctomycetota bacterium]